MKGLLFRFFLWTKTVCIMVGGGGRVGRGGWKKLAKGKKKKIGEPAWHQKYNLVCRYLI